ncbi:MAG: phosphatidate cytidylyltransferase [Candidatus Atribacteria bacterium]|nr:phosphatidate cytidylyltransferase [Candidatus Atribacteria bacterium]
MVNDAKRSDLKTRTLSVLLALPLFLFLLLYNHLTLFSLFIILSFLSIQEFNRMVFHGSSRDFIPVVLSLWAVALFYIPRMVRSESFPLFWWYIFLLAVILWGFLHPENILERVGFFLFGVLYCVILPFFWVRTGLQFGQLFLLGFAMLVWMNDIFAYLIGTCIGRHKVVPRISPGKSWEGLIGGICTSGCVGMVLSPFFFHFSYLWQGLFAGCLVAAVSFFGDIFESAMKRECLLKDSGHFLPGHGGILDRFDSFFMVGPLIFFIGTRWGG